MSQEPRKIQYEQGVPLTPPNLTKSLQNELKYQQKLEQARDNQNSVEVPINNAFILNQIKGKLQNQQISIDEDVKLGYENDRIIIEGPYHQVRETLEKILSELDIKQSYYCKSEVPFSQEEIAYLDQYLKQERANLEREHDCAITIEKNIKVSKMTTIEYKNKSLHLIKGDISLLQTQAVVNWCNDQLIFESDPKIMKANDKIYQMGGQSYSVACSEYIAYHSTLDYGTVFIHILNSNGNMSYILSVSELFLDEIDQDLSLPIEILSNNIYQVFQTASQLDIIEITFPLFDDDLSDSATDKYLKTLIDHVMERLFKQQSNLFIVNLISLDQKKLDKVKEILHKHDGQEEVQIKDFELKQQEIQMSCFVEVIGQKEFLYISEQIQQLVQTQLVMLPVDVPKLRQEDFKQFEQVIQDHSYKISGQMQPGYPLKVYIQSDKKQSLLNQLKFINQYVPQYPLTWDPQTDNFVKIDLPPTHTEFQDINNLILKTDTKAKIYKIYRIQNQNLWDNYANEKKKLLSNRQFNPSEIETYLWHGVRGQHPRVIYDGNQEAFDPRYSAVIVFQSQGGQFGPGTYFARDASYSRGFAYKNKANEPDAGKLVYLCCLLTTGCIYLIIGKVHYCAKNPEIRKPPDGFDCVAAVDGTMYILYGTVAVRRAYPAYEVVFT